jgi:hypothetical protein
MLLLQLLHPHLVERRGRELCYRAAHHHSQAKSDGASQHHVSGVWEVQEAMER